MKTIFLNSMLCAAFAGLSLSSPALATVELTAIQAFKGDGPADKTDRFGASIASDGHLWFFVGAPIEGDGTVYVYRLSSDGTYTPHSNQPKLTIPTDQETPGVADTFGSGVVTGSGWLFVSSAGNGLYPEPDPRQVAGKPAFDFGGKVFVYKFDSTTNAWVFKQVLASSHPGTNSAFGGRRLSKNVGVNRSGDYLLIGEPVVNMPNATARIYLYAREGDTWSPRQPIEVATDTSTIDYVVEGIVGFDNHFVLKIKIETFNNATNPGIFVAQGQLNVYQILAGGTLTQTQTIMGTEYSSTIDCMPSHAFGGMAGGGNSFAITQSCLDADGTPPIKQGGQLDIYSFDGSQPLPLAHKRKIPGTVENGRLGSTSHGGQESLAVSDDGGRILVGAAYGGTEFGLDPSVPHSEYVRFYERVKGRWTWRAALKPSSDATNKMFGQVVAFARDGSHPGDPYYVLVGEPGTPGVQAAGSVYLYKILPPRPPETGATGNSNAPVSNN